MTYKFPIKYYDGNIVYGEQGVWAYYEMNPFTYDFKAVDKKTDLERMLASFFWELETDAHLLVLPRSVSIQSVADNFKATITGPLKDAAIRHTDQVVNKFLIGNYGDGVDYHFYVGLKLDVKEEIGLVETFRSAWTDFSNSMYRATGLGCVLPLAEIKRYRRLEEMTFAKVLTNLSVSRITESDVQFLIERNFTRGMMQEEPVEVKPYYEDRGEKRYVPGNDVLRLAEGLVDDSSLRHIRLTKDGQESQIAFLPVSKVSYKMFFPGCEFIYMLQSFKFPVELSIRVNYIDNETARRIVKNKKQEVDSEGQYAAEAGQQVSNNVMNAHTELHNLESRLESSDGLPLLKTSLVFCVTAPTEAELKERVRFVKNFYRSSCKFSLEQPCGDQFLFFNEFLPGAARYVSDYMHHMEPDALASGMFGAVRKLGDPYGFFVGITGILEQLVYINPALAAQGLPGTVTNSLAATFTGGLGGGKSFWANLLTYLSVLAGGKALIIDPKNERTKWPEMLSELKGHINVITLSAEDRYKGILDPFVILQGKAAEELALSICSFLTGVKSTDIEYFSALSSAIMEAGHSAKPCMQYVIKTLAAGDQDSVKLANSLRSFSYISFVSLLFGDGEPKETISLESAMNILQIQDLQLPDEKIQKEDYSLQENLSLAIMMSITAFALDFADSDRGIFKTILQDESWALLGSSQGRALFNKLLRAGRALNTAVYPVTQMVRDVKEYKNLIGMKFAFRASDRQEIEDILEYFDLPMSESNIRIIKELPNGHCLFKDIYGHVGVLHVNAVFQDLVDAFDTRPKKKKVEECKETG